MPLIGARGVSDQSCVRLKLYRGPYLTVKLTDGRGLATHRCWMIEDLIDIRDLKTT